MKVGIIATVLVYGLSQLAAANHIFELATYELQSGEQNASVSGTLVVDESTGSLDPSNLVDFSIEVNANLPFEFTPDNSAFESFEVNGNGTHLEVPGVTSLGVNSVVLITNDNAILPGCDSCQAELRFGNGLFETADYSRINYTVVNNQGSVVNFFEHHPGIYDQPIILARAVPEPKSTGLLLTVSLLIIRTRHSYRFFG